MKGLPYRAIALTFSNSFTTPRMVSVLSIHTISPPSFQPAHKHLHKVAGDPPIVSCVKQHSGCTDDCSTSIDSLAVPGNKERCCFKPQIIHKPRSELQGPFQLYFLGQMHDHLHPAPFYSLGEEFVNGKEYNNRDLSSPPGVRQSFGKQSS